MENVEKLQPRAFTRFCMSINAVPSSYLAGMTIEEQLLWFCSYLQNEVIPSVNNNAGAVEELQALYTQLLEYVNHYFDNLDVQEEINNKLDEMAESGQLTDIIAQYLQLAGVLAYDTKTAMKNATNLVAGSIVKTLGNSAYSDGQGAFYKVRNILNTDVIDDENIVALHDNTLVAQKILYSSGFDLINNDSNYYNEITYSVNRSNNTDYYLTFIPNEDSNGEQIKPYISQADTNTSPLQNAQKYYTTLTTNASLAVEIDGVWQDGSVISNGEIIHENDSGISLLTDDYDYIAIKNDNSIVSYQANQTTAQEMLADGVVQACLCFGQCVSNGVIKQDFTHQLDKDPDQYIGQKANKDIVILSIDARNSANIGFNYQQASQILIDNGCINVWALDGGGSTSTIYKGSKINMNIDDRGISDRKISYLFNWKKPTINKIQGDTYNQIGKQNFELNKQLRQLINHKQPLMYYAKLRLGEGQTMQASTENVLKLRVVSPTNANVIKINTTNANDNYIYFDLDNDEHLDMSRYILFITATLYVENNVSSSHRVELDLYENNDKELTIRNQLDNGGVTTLTFSEFLYINDDAQIRIKFDPYAGANIIQGVASIFLIPNENKELPLYDIQQIG